MKQALKNFAKFASFPIGMMIFLILFMIGWKFFNLPEFSEIVDYAKRMYEIHGYWVIFIASLAEGLLLINWYLPGSVVIVMGTVLAIDGGQSVGITVSLVAIGLLITSMINFWLGKYGWYKLLLRFGLKKEIEKMHNKLQKHGIKFLILGYFHPHTASLIATSAGILQMETKKFFLYSVLGYLFWGAIWTSVAYIAGPQFLALISFKNLLIIVAFWIFVLAIQYAWTHRKSAPAPIPEPEEISTN